MKQADSNAFIPRDYPKTLTLLIKFIFGEIEQEIGIEHAQNVAFDVAENLRTKYGGITVYVPNMSSSNCVNGFDLYHTASKPGKRESASRITFGELMHEIAWELASRLRDAGMPEGAACSAGANLSRWFRRCYGGSRIYIQRGNRYESDQKGQEVLKRFNGDNTQELALEFKVSRACIYRLLERARAGIKQKNQPLPHTG